MSKTIKWLLAVAAIVIAATVYHAAMREEKLPRFAKENMPKLNYFPTPVPRPEK